MKRSDVEFPIIKKREFATALKDLKLESDVVDYYGWKIIIILY